MRARAQEVEGHGVATGHAVLSGSAILNGLTDLNGLISFVWRFNEIIKLSIQKFHRFAYSIAENFTANQKLHSRQQRRIGPANFVP